MKGKREAGKHDYHSSRHKGKREHTSDKLMSKERFDKEALKQKYLYKA
jgi:hypothetical protein